MKASASELPESHIEKFFARMSSIYGHKFNSLFRDAEALRIGKREWSQALGPLTGAQIRRGLDTCRYLSDWNPNIPEFVRLACNLPSLKQAQSRVMTGNNIDLVSYRISGKLGSFALKNKTELELLRLIGIYYEDVYPTVLAETIGIDDEPEPEQSIEAKPESKPEFKPVSAEEAEQWHKKMREALKASA